MKLYWRYKKDGKWTWKPATKVTDHLVGEAELLFALEEEE